MSKYDPLRKWLQSKPAKTFTASFGEIEVAIGFRLPASARDWKYWWDNEPRHETRHVQCKAWRDAGFQTQNLDLVKETVEFARRDASKG
jgi:hypothetical protein